VAAAGPSFDAVLLAAGRSTRMGRDKALLETAGRPLWERQRAVLARAGARQILLSARSDQAWADAAEGFAGIVRDASLDSGPLGGLVAALERGGQNHLAVLAVDLPRMEPAWFATLLADCTPGRGAVGRSGKWFEPLASVYPREVLPLARAALERGDLALQKLLAEAVRLNLLGVREISAAEAPLFANWNEPAP
jgi:molybdenum cofactor guanylyltransferase